MPTAVIGALRVDLNLGTAGWRTGLDKAARDADQAANKFKATGATITKTGAVLTAGITAPLVGLGTAAIRTAADFETALNKVKIATQAGTADLARMKEMALELGKTTVFSASEAAGAMEELAKNGVSVADILGGAAKAAVDLAAAAGSELEPAAVAVSDAMNQFHLSAKDLPNVVNQITGAVNESKLDFADFQLGMAAAGGVAGGLGVSFADFNAVLAGTSSLFSSGSDAGTAFKSFMTSFVPQSKAAAKAMADYGLTFFDASGKMRSMGDIAGMLREKLGGLSDEAKNDVLKTIFGVDAMRTAIGLMNLGADGLDKIADKIAKTDAAAQSAERMKGLNAQLEQLGGSLETLAIRIGDTGLLQSVTSVVSYVTDLVDKLTEISPVAAQVAVGVAAVAAAFGPVMLVLGPLISAIGTVISTFAGWQAALATASAAAGGLAPLLAPLAPIIAGVAIAAGALYAVWKNWDTIAPILEGLWATFQETLGPPLKIIMDGLAEAARLFARDLGALLVAAGDALGPAFLGLFKGAATLIGGTFRLIGGLLSSVIALLRGDFSGAWSHAWKAIVAADTAIDTAVRQMVSGILESLGKLVSGVWKAIVGDLGGAWDALKKRVKEAKDDFFGLYDAVVGHSYIPDMVDGIAAHMARLDDVMTKPTKKATDATKDAFRKLQDDLKPILDELFPDERRLVEFERKMATIARAEKAGVKGGGLSAEQAEEARNRLRYGTDWEASRQVDIGGVVDREFDPLKGAGKDLTDLMVKLPDLAKKTTAETVEAFAGMARDVVGSLRGMVAAFKGGDILGGLTGLLDIVGQVAGLIRGNSTPRVAAAPAALPYGGGRALGGPVVPGKRYRVGERGRGEWFEPHVPGRVVPDRDGDRGGNVYHFSGNLMTPEFWQRIEAGDDAAAVRGATGGATLAQEQAAYSRGRYLG